MQLQAQQLVWWQVATDIVGLPATIVGLVFSFFQIQKTRLESKKIRLEIIEKKATLGIIEQGAKAPAVTARRARLAVAYSFLAAALTGGYIFIFQGTTLLPVTSDESAPLLALLFPVWVAQITLTALWVRHRHLLSPSVPLPLWASYAPFGSNGNIRMRCAGF